MHYKSSKIFGITHSLNKYFDNRNIEPLEYMLCLFLVDMTTKYKLVYPLVLILPISHYKINIYIVAIVASAIRDPIEGLYTSPEYIVPDSGGGVGIFFRDWDWNMNCRKSLLQFS